ncbi:MAG: shikimate kinase AroK [Gammaproteobacteria bacterium]
MSKADNLFLIGPMGAGKSSIGRKLSLKLARPFWDSDKVLEQRTGVDIPTIFEFEREAGFRARESRIIDELTRKSGIVLATGGGAVLSQQNREWLQARGLVVYLCATVNTQLRRTARNRNRPLLHTPDPQAKLTLLFQQRDPLYRQIADLVVSTDNVSIPVVTERLLQQITIAGKNSLNCQIAP